MLEGITLMPTKGNIWTYPKSPVPTFLADAGVPQEVWSTTYDAIVKHINRFRDISNHVKASRKWALLAEFVTCIVFFLLFVGMFLLLDHDNDLSFLMLVFMFLVACFIAPLVGGYCSRRPDGETCSTYVVKWGRFVEAQKNVYRPFGIDCQMIKAPVVAGGAKKVLVLGGVNFRPLPPQTAGLVPERSVASELESLRDLHQSGALTDEEYTRAKAHVLAMPNSSCNNLSSSLQPPIEPIPESRAVPAGNETTCAYAQVVQDSEVMGTNNSSGDPDHEKIPLTLV